MASTDRCIVITGAAGALGRVVAQSLRGDGRRLLLVDRDLAALRAAFADADADADAALRLLAADVTDAAALDGALRDAFAACGAPQALLHCAGGFAMGPTVFEMERADWQHLLDLNAWSFVACARAVVPAMIAAGGGRIVAVSARSASRGEARMAAYIAAKSALQRLVEALSAEVREQGIAVNSIAPSIIDTPANRAAMPDADPSRWVAPQALAQAMRFLLSEAGGAVHGQHLVVSGLS